MLELDEAVTLSLDMPFKRVILFCTKGRREKDDGVSNFHMLKQYRNSLLASNMHCSSMSPDLPYLENRKLITALVIEGSSNGGFPRYASTDNELELLIWFELDDDDAKEIVSFELFNIFLRRSLNKK